MRMLSSLKNWELRLLTPFALLSMVACKTRNTFYKGTFNGKNYRLVSIETKGFSTNSFKYTLKLDGQKSVSIDASNLDWGPPYADDLYGNTPRVYLAKDQPAYENDLYARQQPYRGTMLYLSPSRFNRAAFDAYVAFMQSEWPKIDRRFGTNDLRTFPHIMGLVYGRHQTFTRTFRGLKGDRIYYIDVMPDGRIEHGVDASRTGFESSGLSPQVQMPGKVIYVATGKNTVLTLAEVLTYKDDAGKTLGDYFTLRERAVSTGQ